jgi:hypothetical protein
VAFDRALDVRRRAVAEPGLEDRGDRAPIRRRDPDDDLADTGAARDARTVGWVARRPAGQDTRATRPRSSRLDTQQVDGTPEPDPGTIDEGLGARSRHGLSCPALMVEVPPEPGLALAEERLDVSRGVARARTTGGDRHDDTPDGIDDEPESAGPP